MNRKDIVGLLAAFAVTAGLFLGLWYFLANYWGSLPAWLAIGICVLVAVAAIGSPIYTLARISNRMMEASRDGES